MITVKLADILNDQVEIGSGYRIYVIRDDETVFYVGKSRNHVLDRILTHCGLGSWSWSRGKSGLGKFIDDNKPASLGWQVDLMTLEDCEPLINKHYPMFERFDMDTAERVVIRGLGPCLNVICNPNPTRLPEKYKKSDVIDIVPGDYIP